ncbi:hypothetical protein [Polluticoccus soli]|uniref:hypothetical protein n=1 Tax=Polluticoccus soli TaxID=3034150 RepID=UPI0023E33539|nr:hypothetical protein [Flavipsychrobacter sp. JY13-12]
MLTFLLYTIVALIANACLVRILYISIQPGKWLDKLLNWQQRLQKWDLQGKTFLVKAGGYCELCFSHFITFISFWCYVLVCKVVIGFWLTAGIDNIFLKVAVNIIWYLVYISVGTNIALFFISNPLKTKQN